MRAQILILTFCFAAFAQEARPPYSLQPDSVAAQSAFDLHLLSYRFTCGTTYSHQSAKIEGKKVTLSFLPTERPEAICPAVYMPYGPTFTMTPLAAGYYDVYARQLTPCMVDTVAICAMEPVPEFAGVLSVGVTGRRGWFLQPKQVPADQAFTMRLLNDAYGNCQTSFSHEALEQQGGAFYASFVVEQHPENVCVTDIRPHGPAFEVIGQPKGKYAVYVNPQPACRFASPPCLASSPDLAVFVDTLTVGGLTGIRGDAPARSGRATSPGPATIQGYRPDGRLPKQ
jgi:hypothetical protein